MSWAYFRVLLLHIAQQLCNTQTLEADKRADAYIKFEAEVTKNKRIFEPRIEKYYAHE